MSIATCDLMKSAKQFQAGVPPLISPQPMAAFGNSGSRTFYSDQTMVMKQNYGQEPATANSPEMK